MATSFDKDSTAHAAERIEALFPSKRQRQAVLGRLLKSIEIANAVAPNAWGVTLFPDYFRLNVGQAEVFVANASGFFINCSASTSVAPFNTAAFEAATYGSVPQPQCRYRGRLALLNSLPEGVETAHAKFIDQAARSPSGKPRAGTPLTKSHSEGLVRYAEQLLTGSKTGA